MALFLYPLERESYYSLLRRTIYVYQMKLREFLGLFDYKSKGFSPFVDYVNHTLEISKKLENHIGFDELLTRHTLYNLTSHFFNDDYKHKFYEGLVSNTINTDLSLRFRLLYRNTVNIMWPKALILKNRFCPQCVLEQKQNYGTTWLRIEWAIPGLELCPKCKSRLVYPDLINYDLICDELTESPCKDVNYANKKPVFFMENVMAILNKEVTAVDSNLVFDYMLERLIENDVTDCRYKEKTIKAQFKIVPINRELLRDILYDFWGQEFIGMHYRSGDWKDVGIPYELMNGENIQSTYLSRWFYALVTLLALSPGKNIRQIIQEIK